MDAPEILLPRRRIIDPTERRQRVADSKAKQRTRRRLFQYFLTDGFADDELAFFLDEYLQLQYPRQASCPNHIPPFQILSDLYFDRVRAMLIYASRASGKTLTFAVMNLLDGCFRPEAIDITNAAATREQAVQCYRYFTGFHRDPLLANLLVYDPTQSYSEYKTGATVEVVTGSIKGLNSRHPAKSRIDEIELVPYETLKKGLSMSQSKGCVPAMDMFASTRRWGGGTTTRLLNEADACGIAVRPYGVVGDTPIDGPRDLARYPQGIPIRELVGREFLMYTWSPEQGNLLLARAHHVRCTRRHAAVCEVTYTWGFRRNRRDARLVATPDHPVLLPDGRWKALKDLQPGDRLRALRRCYSRQGSRQRLYASVIPDARRSSYVHEHRYIMHCLRGPLDPQWHVDHVDNNSLNNATDNLHYLPRAKHGQKCARESWDALGRQRKLEGLRAAWRGARRQDRRRKLQEKVAQQRRQADELNHRVASVRFHGYADVYTMDVDAGDNGVANGIVVHSRVGEGAER